jgi:hypothetical protein
MYAPGVSMYDDTDTSNANAILVHLAVRATTQVHVTSTYAP